MERNTAKNMMVVFTIALVALTGCRTEEQNRVTTFKPGMYQGKQDAALDQSTLNALRSRASLQSTP